MADGFQAGFDPTSRLTFGAAITTTVCRDAQKTHQLEPTSAIALGRLLTATAFVARGFRDYEMASLQILCWGRLGQVFADINHQGNLRGYVKNPFMALPMLPGENAGGRRSIARGIGGGTLSVIRAVSGNGFTQGTTELVGCEVDDDVQHFLQTSDQLPTTILCEVLLDANGHVEHAGGVSIQAMPDADLAAYDTVKKRLLSGQLAEQLVKHHREPGDLMKALFESSRTVGQPSPLAFRCRCSYERVVAALRMLGPEQLAEMVQKGEEPDAACEFCGTKFVIAKADVERVFNDTIVARG